MNDSELKALDKKHVMQTYKRFDVVFNRGEGCYVYDTNGKKYLDFMCGIATSPLGHANSDVAKAITDQANTLISVSNLYYSEPPILLAQKLSELSGLQKCFFSHSGADASETAIKLTKRVTGKTEFIAFKNSFHGRTTGSLALTWKHRLREPFLPLSPSVVFAEFGEAQAVEKLITKDTAGLFVEPIQGEAGIVVPLDGFLKRLRDICTKHKILLIVDEVQTGVGRTGSFFAYRREGIQPDIVTAAKGLANGVPIGVCLSNFDFEPGDHGSTLGGNNLSAAAALATIEYIEKNELLLNAEEMGNYLMQELQAVKNTCDLIKDVRGAGLMIGIILKDDNAQKITQQALENGLICNAPTPDVIRLLPPLIITKKQADDCVSILKKAMQA